MQVHYHDDLIKSVVKIAEAVKEFLSLFRKQRATQEIVNGKLVPRAKRCAGVDVEWLVVSVSVLQRHNGLKVSRKLWRHLRSYRWRKLSLNLFKSLALKGFKRFVESGNGLDLIFDPTCSILWCWKERQCYWIFLIYYIIE